MLCISEPTCPILIICLPALLACLVTSLTLAGMCNAVSLPKFKALQLLQHIIVQASISRYQRRFMLGFFSLPHFAIFTTNDGRITSVGH